jgi:hypothetical protein
MKLTTVRPVYVPVELGSSRLPSHRWQLSRRLGRGSLELFCNEFEYPPRLHYFPVLICYVALCRQNSSQGLITHPGNPTGRLKGFWKTTKFRWSASLVVPCCVEVDDAAFTLVAVFLVVRLCLVAQIVVNASILTCPRRINSSYSDGRNSVPFHFASTPTDCDVTITSPAYTMLISYRIWIIKCPFSVLFLLWV